MSEFHRDIITIGASTGGVQALMRLLGQFQAELPAAVFIVLHIAPDSPSVLAELLNRTGPLPAQQAIDGEAIVTGRVYVAPPDRHLMVAPGHVRVIRGPRENRVRPAIDPLFRSAAVAYATRVIGVVLTGYLDDGAAGLAAVKRCGGVAIVQSPGDAQVPEMPRSALAQAGADYIEPLDRIAPLLANLTCQVAPPPPPIPRDLLMEVEMASDLTGSVPGRTEIGMASSLSCPECGGVLREIPEAPNTHYRCQVGHSYTLPSLLADQSSLIERALWAAIRSLEERASLMSRMGQRSWDRNHDRSADEYQAQAVQARAHAQTLRDVLVRGAAESA